MEQANFIKFSAFLVGKRVELEKHMNIDGKEEEISTRADGYWGDCQEFSHTYKGKETLDAVIITILFSEIICQICSFATGIIILLLIRSVIAIILAERSHSLPNSQTIVHYRLEIRQFRYSGQCSFAVL